jgi:hypothetical protein
MALAPVDSVGALLPNPAAAAPAAGGAGCADAYGADVACCVWQGSDWAAWYTLLTAIFTLWTLLLVFSVKSYVVAGATAQW